MSTNAAELRSRLERVRDRIRAACQRCGRSAEEVTLVSVSKRQPVEKIRWAFEAGQRIFGENLIQEAAAKRDELPASLDWHLIGPLQSNKVKAAVRQFQTIHSLDRMKIARRLDREAEAQGKKLRVFVQINIGLEETKHGFSPETFLEEVQPLAELSCLQVVGLMAIPPAERDPERTRGWFRRLAEQRDRSLEQPWWPREAVQLSMGMSNDFEIAIEEGATHVRVGSSIFGPRS